MARLWPFVTSGSGVGALERMGRARREGGREEERPGGTRQPYRLHPLLAPPAQPPRSSPCLTSPPDAHRTDPDRAVASRARCVPCLPARAARPACPAWGRAWHGKRSARPRPEGAARRGTTGYGWFGAARRGPAFGLGAGRRGAAGGGAGCAARCAVQSVRPVSGPGNRCPCVSSRHRLAAASLGR